MDKKPVIYFDNAASTHPKPETVYAAADRQFRAGGSPGRSAHALAMQASELVFETRLKLAAFLGVDSPERIIFTPGCTQSVNMVLRGIGLKAGDTVLVSALEHNAVMRPLQQMKTEKGISVECIPYKPGRILDLQDLSDALERLKPKLCVFMEASNVSGEILDLSAVSNLCSAAAVPLLVDAAQSAGAFQSKLNASSPTFWCTSGHKGLFGMAGVGLLYVHPSFDLEPFVYGGTGSHSELFEMPLAYPDRLEPGTMPAPAIAALSAGLDFIESSGIEKIVAHESSLCRKFLGWLKDRERFEVILPDLEKRLPLISFKLQDKDPAMLAELLDRDYGICTRAGLHCASSAHKVLGSIKTGLLRISFGYFNTESELKILCDALEHI
ncbi:MAG: aminotransferase class V-fold PLP-dependent enzyme [Candidatus Obscuribacterales bacterium]|nr:aminotransferase class V-fold PLP-dependent enzyme [Candidatus Obscuribacterales bacterium]